MSSLPSPSFTPSKTSEETTENLEIFYDYEDESPTELSVQSENNTKKCISVGEFLPYGPRMYYETNDNVVRMKDIGEKNRILVVGVIGSFTPDCWNRHLYLVLQKLKYYEEREVDYICCISTNDAYTQKAWGTFLGCEDTVLMWGDPNKRFTKAIGMDIVVPCLDNTVRSSRYVLLADDMVVTNIIVAPHDHAQLSWRCEHFAEPESEAESVEHEQDSFKSQDFDFSFYF